MSHSGMVRVTHDFVVRLGFSDGTVRALDLEPVLWGLVFEPLLSDSKLFRQVTVDDELGTIVWPNGADMDPVVLHARLTGTYEELMRGEAASGRTDRRLRVGVMVGHPGTLTGGSRAPAP